MDWRERNGAAPAAYRDDSPLSRGRAYRSPSVDSAESYSDGGGRIPACRARSRSPYDCSVEGTESEDASDVEPPQRGDTRYHNGRGYGPRRVSRDGSDYTEQLEKDNRVLQQQLRDLKLQTQTKSVFGTADTAVHAGSSKAAIPLTGKDAGPSLEVSRMKKKHNDYGQPKIVKDREAVEKNGAKNFSNKTVLTVIREFDANKQYWRKHLEIFSPGFSRLIKDTPGFGAGLDVVDGVIQITEPFISLFHNRQALIRALQDEKWLGINDLELLQARSHARIILTFMSDDLSETTTKLNDIESESPANLITFEEIWMLYKPGTVVYSLENGQWEAFVVEELRGLQKHRRSSRSGYSHTRLDLICWSIDYDGEIFGRRWSQHCLSPFRGAKNVSSLNLVPEKFLPEASNIKDSLLARGKGFWSLQGQQYREYTGETYTLHTNEEATRVMVDHLTYQRRNDWPIRINGKVGPSDLQSKNWKDNKFARDDFDDDRPRRGRRRCYSPDRPCRDEVDDWVPDEFDGPNARYSYAYQRFTIERPPVRAEDSYKQYDAIQPSYEPDDLVALLCPQHVHGFCLRDKVWKKLNVNELRPVTFRPNAWDRLVLDAEYKTIIQAMVSSYVSKSAHLDDLIASKGNGLAVLLHGPPGSGKTLTAECVADAYRKPLYQVTCGDLGTDPLRLEDRLGDVFDYAVTWGAILLLDEADIFLQDRDMQSLKRNALVSIFLRTLDYFSGILFLTTNRVTTFDQAFQSRIHVTLGVPALDQTRRVQVWDIFVDDLAAKAAITPERHTLLKQLVRERWSKQRLNGRQIRNAMRTALVLAEKKGATLGADEIAVVLKIGREFEGYLGQGKGVMGGLEGFEEVVEP